MIIDEKILCNKGKKREFFTVREGGIILGKGGREIFVLLVNNMSVFSSVSLDFVFLLLGNL